MHLYLHIPFCARRCSYCDFAIAVRKEVPSRRYADGLSREWMGWRDDPRWARFPELDTLYLGGGTPSMLDPWVLAELLGRIIGDRPLRAGAEVTLEANPDDVSADRVHAWRNAGINRVSLGVQSFDPAVLQWMHRTHTSEQSARAVELLRAGGISQISLDLIYALPGDLNRDWRHDLEQGLALAPDHLSLYGLTVEQHTPLSRWVNRGEARPAPEERYADEFLLAHGLLTQSGFRHYEVSNYARPGREALHNSAYWSRSPYLGLGPSAHSGLEDHRWWNLREWSAWEEAVSRGVSTVAGEEILGLDALRLEALYLGLRTDTGIATSALAPATVTAWLQQAWASVEGARIRLTPEGWLRLDALVASAAGASSP